LRDFQPIGPYVDVISVPSPNDRNRFLSHDRERFIKLGLEEATIDRLRRFGLATTVAQYYGNVQEGLFFADDVVHLFRGLKRPLMHLDNVRGDQFWSIRGYRVGTGCGTARLSIPNPRLRHRIACLS
jgi:hypothetical protein